MAPRTPDQQKAYNEKRRAENAARKADADAWVTAVKAERKAIKTPKLKPARAKAKRKSVSEAPVAAKVPVKRTVRGKGGDTALHASRPTRKPATVVAAKPEVTYSDIPGVKAYNVHADKSVKPKQKFPMEVYGVVSEPNKQEHTMAKSYLRSGAPGKGKLRSGTYQCTVSFTEAQMDQVVSAAGFRGVSLAEMIRSCVVRHLNHGLSGHP